MELHMERSAARRSTEGRNESWMSESIKIKIKQNKPHGIPLTSFSINMALASRTGALDDCPSGSSTIHETILGEIPHC